MLKSIARVKTPVGMLLIATLLVLVVAAIVGGINLYRNSNRSAGQQTPTDDPRYAE